jgi:HSP20 family protein
MDLSERKLKKRTKNEKKKGELAIRRNPESIFEIDRPFGWPISSPRGWFGPRWWRPIEFPSMKRALVDMIDTGKEYRVHAEVPGIPKEKLSISVTSNGIKIEGEAETEIDENKEGYVHKERTWSSVKRELAFPEQVVPEKADAQVKNGVLEVTVPKKHPTEMKAHKVQVR